ncbi:MAG: GNAT family N-acetyltransferase [Pirellulaceae bacterium]
MTEQLVCTYANPDQQQAAYRNTHEFWSGGRTLEEHLQWRRVSPQHNRARWCVGCLDDQVVVSLGCYPVQLSWQGEQIAAILIGAVHTLPAYRGRGYAPRLLAWVEEQERQQGVCVSGLFSDIDADYYGRFGYERCDSWELKIPVTPDSETVMTRWTLQPMDPHQQLSRLRQWYEASQRNLSVWLVRDDAYWQYMLSKSSSDRFFQLVDSQEQTHGYVRLQVEGDSWVIQDWGLAQPSTSGLEDMLVAILQQASQQAVSCIRGWLPFLEKVSVEVDFEPRPQEITMFKSLDPDRQVVPEIVQAAAYLREIDHV